MLIERTKDILVHARAFHHMIAEAYHKLDKSAGGLRIRMLLEYLETHEKHLEETLAEYEDQAAPKVLQYWFRTSPVKEKFIELRAMLARDCLTEDCIVTMAIDIDDCMIDMYKYLVLNAESEDVRAAFEALMSMEENEERRMVRAAMRMQDI